MTLRSLWVLCSFALLAADCLAASDSNDPATTGIDEILVTAQRRTEKLQDVPITIQVAQGRELADLVISTNDQLMSIVPDLRVGSSFGALVQDFTLRGIGPANNFNSNVEPPVGLYMDDIYQSFIAAPGTQLFDLERVEVLKGPQGTLYGRNTTGGAISYISNKPGIDAEQNHGEAELGVGNYNRVEVQSASDVTFIDHVLGARVAIYHAAREGYVENVGPTGPHTFGSEHTTDGRVLLRFIPDQHWDTLLALYVNRFDGSTVGGIGYGIYPLDTLDFPGGYSRAGLTPYQAALNYAPGTSSHSTAAALTTAWTSGALKLTSITSYEAGAAFATNDCDSSPLDICASASRPTSRQAGEEFRADYSSDRFHVLGGASYDWDRYATDINAAFGGISFFDNSYQQTRQSVSAHIDATYAIDRRLDLTLGVRDTWDDTRISQVRTLLLSSIDGTPVGMSIPVEGPFIPGLFLPAQRRTDDGVSGRAVLTYKPIDNLMSYLSFSRGYRAGAFNGVQLESSLELNSVGPEIDHQIELGVKATFNERVSANAALFDIEISNQQVVSQDAVGPCPSCTPPRAGLVVPSLQGLKGYSRGAEFDLNAALVASLRAGVGLTLLDTRYDEGANQQISGIPAAGKHFPFAPTVGVHADAAWTPWHRDHQKLILAADVNYTGHYWFDPTNGTNEIGLGFINQQGQKAYALLDTRLTYERGSVRLMAWGKNLFNQYYIAGANNEEAAFGSTLTLSGEPRTFGLDATLTF